MSEDLFPDTRAARPIWLMTLADLALLLVGFFVLVQASQTIPRQALARGIREGFGATEPRSQASPVADPMPVGVGAMAGFMPGSSSLPHATDSLAAWAGDALRDPRVTLRITGFVDGSTADVDPVTGSGTLLAVDRARAVAQALATSGHVPADRMTIAGTTTAGGARRDVIVTIAFAGERQ